MKPTPIQGIPDRDYRQFLEGLKRRIAQSRTRASLSVNRELIVLYWHIGQDILRRQQADGWGTKVIDRLAKDLRQAFPDMKGLSATNLKYMRKFAESWPEEAIVQQLVGLLPWGHNLRLLDKVSDTEQRCWYIRQTIAHGWSRNVLVHQIESELYERQGSALTNFSETLPPSQSDLAQALVKDPYSFEFLGISEGVRERELEQALTGQLRDFMLELGRGFAWVGNQYHLEVGGEDFYVDLLFYHLKLHAYIAIDLKVGPFRPEYAGKMNFYLTAIDETVRQPGDGPSIGLILCKDRNQVIVEYALRDSHRPIGVARYTLLSDLPQDIQESLPSVEELAAELSGPDEK